MVLSQLFDKPKPIIGVVHLLPLPTSPRWAGSFKEVIDRAEQEATALAAGGVQGILIENFFDAPFTKGSVDPAIVSVMSLVVQRVIQMVDLPVGINVLRNDGRSAMAIAACVGAQFIRVNVLTGVMATDQGIIEGDAYNLLRYRRELGCDVKIFADVLVKHAQPLSQPNLTLAIQDTIHRGLADAIVLSGWSTGDPPQSEALREAIAACGGTPMLIGSGANWENISQLIEYADGVIVSSSLKRHGKLQLPIDPIRVSRFVESMRLALDGSDNATKANAKLGEKLSHTSLPVG
ncbi:photosystem I biogenesis protein BtpA [Pseudanabaena sp. PCC 6802]|uniref:photosystem I biogenesis protein BtpA n=1 Tax=Pseudanabaena sp. PCC 6802 TaxID=118173 RepID=UPI000347EFEC|nr:BtpA/SgcQ family protein [Pseudanabaena sp. PCC 6802]